MRRVALVLAVDAHGFAPAIAAAATGAIHFGAAPTHHHGHRREEEGGDGKREGEGEGKREGEKEGEGGGIADLPAPICAALVVQRVLELKGLRGGSQGGGSCNWSS